MVKHSATVVGTAATSLTSTVPDRKGAGGDISRSALIQNPGSVDVFIGGAGVTSTSYGVKLPAGGTLSVDLGTGEELFAAVATGTATVTVLHTGV